VDVNDRSDPVVAARGVLEARYPTALCAFVAGSVLRGEATSTSDLDLVVVTTQPHAPFRESFHHAGWPVEAFVHTTDSYRTYFASDAAARTPALPTMCLEGEVLRDTDGLAARIKGEARTLIERGPEPLSVEECENQRYMLSDALDDLIGTAGHAEGTFIAVHLTTHAVHLYLTLRGQWSGHGKWTMRALQRADPEVAARVGRSLDDYLRHDDKSGLIRFVEGVLDRAGGRLFDGYYRAGRT
jgi:hypothetical protein